MVNIYFFDSHIAGNWGTAYRGYRIVEVLNNGEILTYQMNPSSMQKVNDKAIYQLNKQFDIQVLLITKNIFLTVFFNFQV